MTHKQSHHHLSRRVWLYRMGAYAFSGGLMASCSLLDKSDMTSVTLKIQVGETINPNSRGRPSPVVMRVYYLLSADEFGRADFFDLFDDDRKTLGQDLVGSREFELVPGEKNIYSAEFSPRAAHLGVIAAFRDLESAKWRISAPLAQNESNDFAIHLDVVTVSLTDSGAGW